MQSMLNEIGIESFQVLINTERGSIARDTPAHLHFDHAIVGIKLPDGVADSSLIATLRHPSLGTILFFDPTDPFTPFGQIMGSLQANYGLLVKPNGGELLELPMEAPSMSTIRRTGKLTLDASGKLSGDVKEERLGDRARSERGQLLRLKNDADRLKPIETLLASSLSSFRITHASILNLHRPDQPFGFDYSFQSENYAKNAGNLLLVRPRVIGTKSQGFLETKEPRRFPIEFEGPLLDTDTFEITIPPGYEVDNLPVPVDADYVFASYHSKTEASGGVIRYTRTFEIKEVSVPVSRSEELRKLYRTIATDERNTVVLRTTKQ